MKSTTFPTSLLDRIYSLPNPYRSIDDWFRTRHEDLPGLSDRELTREIRRVSARLDFEWPERGHWLWARLDACHAEQGKRRASVSDPRQDCSRSRPSYSHPGTGKLASQSKSANLEPFERRGGKLVRS